MHTYQWCFYVVEFGESSFVRTSSGSAHFRCEWAAEYTTKYFLNNKIYTISSN